MTLQNVKKWINHFILFSTLGGKNAKDLSKTEMVSQLWKAFLKTEPMRQHNSKMAQTEPYVFDMVVYGHFGSTLDVYNQPFYLVHFASMAPLLPSELP